MNSLLGTFLFSDELPEKVNSGMANNPAEGYPDDFLEQILAIPAYNGLAGGDGSSSENSQLTAGGQLGSGAGVIQQPFFPLGLSLDNGQHVSFLILLDLFAPGFLMDFLG